MALNIVDLFSSCGGLSLGFQNAGNTILAAVCVFLAKIENYDATFITACIILISSGLKAIFQDCCYLIKRLML